MNTRRAFIRNLLIGLVAAPAIVRAALRPYKLNPEWVAAGKWGDYWEHIPDNVGTWYKGHDFRPAQTIHGEIQWHRCKGW